MGEQAPGSGHPALTTRVSYPTLRGRGRTTHKLGGSDLPHGHFTHTQPPPPTNKARTWSITKGPRPHAPTPTRRPPHTQQPRPHLHTT